MTDRPDFGLFLRQTMEAMGYSTVRSLSRASGIGEAVLGRWLANESWPTIEALRELSPAIKVPLLELLVAAGRLTLAEARLEAMPEPPEPLPFEDEIWARRDMSRREKEHLIAYLQGLRASTAADRAPLPERREA